MQDGTEFIASSKGQILLVINVGPGWPNNEQCSWGEYEHKLMIIYVYISLPIKRSNSSPNSSFDWVLLDVLFSHQQVNVLQKLIFC